MLARSAFHHSINYRSVVIFGNAKVVDDPDEKINALHAFTDQVVPGRWKDVRRPRESEMRATLVLKLPLVEVSAKVRTGPPIDDEEFVQPTRLQDRLAERRLREGVEHSSAR